MVVSICWIVKALRSRSGFTEMIRTSTCLGLLLTTAVTAAASADLSSPPRDLLWPLGIRSGITASFGEYRGDRFHGGVDLSTRGETGHEVFAAADGELFRLKIEWRGYGNAVYLRHAGGWVTVYAHLDRLENRLLRLQDRIAARRAATGERFPGDIYLSPTLPVSRGQVIGWSGQSGAGGPHLHFELRDPLDRPADPVRHITGWPGDDESPRIQAITLTMAEPGGFIDGHLRRRRIPVVKRRGEYTATTIPITDGPFTATLETMDPAGGGHRLGVRRLRAGLDDGTDFEFELERFRFADARQAGLVFDLDMSGFSPTVYAYRLVRREGNSLARGVRRFEPGTEGIHSLWFEASDSAGNSATGRIALLVGAAPQLRNPTLRREQGRGWLSYRLDPGARDAIESLQGEPLALEFAHAVEPYRTFRVIPLPGPLPPSPVPVELEGVRTGRLVSFRARLRCGGFRTRWLPVRLTTAESDPAIDPLPTPLDIDWSLDLFESGADLWFTADPPRPQPPAIRIAASSPAASTAAGSGWDAGSFVATIPLTGFGPRPAGIGVEDPAAGFDRIDLPIRLFRPEPDRDFHLQAFGAELEIPAGALFDRQTLVLHPEVQEPPEGLTPRGGPVRLRPDGTVFRRPVRLRLQARTAPPDPHRLGIFRWDPRRNRWSFQGPTDPGSGGSDRISIRRGGTYALLEDSREPRLGDSFPRPGGSVTRDVDLWVDVEEIGKGLDWDGVEFRLDGRKLIAVFDPDRNRAEASLEATLPAGAHRLRMVATDRAGNRSEPKEVGFVVESGPPP